MRTNENFSYEEELNIKHIISKPEICSVETYNSVLRYYLAILTGKTKCFSKSIQMLEPSITLLLFSRMFLCVCICKLLHLCEFEHVIIFSTLFKEMCLVSLYSFIHQNISVCCINVVSCPDTFVICHIRRFISRFCRSPIVPAVRGSYVVYCCSQSVHISFYV